MAFPSTLDENIFHNHSISYNDSSQEDQMEYNGKKYYISKQGYYSRDERKNGKRKMILLHRVIWEEANGSIPVGYHIHHKDENRLNNSLDNLELLPSSQHSSHHRKEEFNEGNLSYLVSAQKKWLQTEKGKLEKSKSCKQGWLTRKISNKICQHCSESFQTKSPQAKFCSQSCKYKNWWHKDKK